MAYKKIIAIMSIIFMTGTTVLTGCGTQNIVETITSDNNSRDEAQEAENDGE